MWRTTLSSPDSAMASLSNSGVIYLTNTGREKTFDFFHSVRQAHAHGQE